MPKRCRNCKEEFGVATFGLCWWCRRAWRWGLALGGAVVVIGEWLARWVW